MQRNHLLTVTIVGKLASQVELSRSKLGAGSEFFWGGDKPVLLKNYYMNLVSSVISALFFDGAVFNIITVTYREPLSSAGCDF